jgi:hypothetical protein
LTGSWIDLLSTDSQLKNHFLVFRIGTEIVYFDLSYEEVAWWKNIFIGKIK